MNIDVSTCNACPLSMINWNNEIVSCGAMKCVDMFSWVDLTDGLFDPFHEVHQDCPFRNKDFSINIKLNDGV